MKITNNFLKPMNLFFKLICRLHGYIGLKVNVS